MWKFLRIFFHWILILRYPKHVLFHCEGPQNAFLCPKRLCYTPIQRFCDRAAANSTEKLGILSWRLPFLTAAIFSFQKEFLSNQAIRIWLTDKTIQLNDVTLARVAGDGGLFASPKVPWNFCTAHIWKFATKTSFLHVLAPSRENVIFQDSIEFKGFSLMLWL